MHSLLFIIFFLSLHLLSPTIADLASDTAALLSFRIAVGRAVLPWNASLSSCQWKGITCSNNRVITLRLPATGLIGQIPSGTIGNLTELRVISLRHNALSGPLPADLARCARLRAIHLERNRFSGKFPLFLSSLHNLSRLNLAENNFVGEIPSSINNLKHLTALYLESNGFVGEMPDFDIPKLVRFNVSFNHLNGSVPEKLWGMPVESFLGMSMCGGPLKPCVSHTSTSPSSKNSSNLSGGAIAGIAIGAIVLLVLILLTMFLLFWCKTKRGESRSTEIHPIQESNVEHGNAAPVQSPGIGVTKKQLVFLPGVPRVFDLETLLRASAEVLGKGKTCITYKAEMEVDLAVTAVVVKRFKDLKMEKKEFVKKIETIGAAKHANLVPLLAYYYSKEEKLLVYDYIQEPNLSSILHGVGKSHLNWENRVNIALDVAQGIEHIHSISPNSAHGNIKSSNILVTRSFGSRLADHGVAQFARSVTREGDIFGFGIVLIELVTGKAPDPGQIAKGGVGVPRWAELFDEELVRLGSPEEEMIMLLEIGVECSSELPRNRPAMAAVVARIEGIRRNGARRKEMLDEEGYGEPY